MANVSAQLNKYAKKANCFPLNDPWKWSSLKGRRMWGDHHPQACVQSRKSRINLKYSPSMPSCAELTLAVVACNCLPAEQYQTGITKVMAERTSCQTSLVKHLSDRCVKAKPVTLGGWGGKKRKEEPWGLIAGTIKRDKWQNLLLYWRLSAPAS